MTDPRRADNPPLLRRVVFICPRIPELGGGGTATEAISSGLVKAGIDVTHVTLSPGIRPPAFPTSTVFELGDAHRTPAFRGAHGLTARARGSLLAAHKRVDRRRGLRRLRRFIESLDTNDVVVFTNLLPKITLDQSGYRRTSESPIFIGQHHSSFHGQGSEWERGPRMRHFDDLDLFLALTDEDAELFRSVVHTVCDSVPNVARALDHTRHRPAHVAVALARYEREKRLDLMIDAFATATASDKLRDWELHLYGEGSLRPELAQLIHRKDLDDRVRLMGRTDEVDTVLETAAINLLTSEFEGFPMSVLEASGMGIPSISFDCSPGVRSLVSAATGALVPPDDLESYATELRTLMADDAARDRKGQAARESMVAFGEEAVVAQWFALLRTCFERRRELSTATPPGVGA